MLDKFEYDENVPSCLVYKNSGKMVGYIKTGVSGSQYWYTNSGNICRIIHRIIWELKNGKIPTGYVINHIDTNSLNNKISNLELCTQAENNRRQGQHVLGKARKDSALNITGVKIICAKGYYYSVARIRVNGKLIEKLFSHAKYGSELATEMAVSYREQMLQDAIKQGLGFYTPDILNSRQDRL